MLSTELSNARERIVKARDLQELISPFVAMTHAEAALIYRGLSNPAKHEIRETIRYVIEHKRLPPKLQRLLTDNEGLQVHILGRLQHFWRQGVFHN